MQMQGWPPSDGGRWIRHEQKAQEIKGGSKEHKRQNAHKRNQRIKHEYAS